MMKYTATNLVRTFLSFLSLTSFLVFSPANATSPTAIDEHKEKGKNGQAEQDVNKQTITNQEQLAKIVRQIKDPSTRLQALSTLFACASGVLYQNSGNMQFYLDGKTRKLHEDAAQAMRKASNDENLKLMLLSCDQQLNGWAIHAIDKKNVALVPALKEVVSKEEFCWHDSAIEKLQIFPGTEDFVKQYVATTKDPWVLLKQVHNDKEFDSRILALLNDHDQKIRISTLNFVGSNKSCAEMFHKNFDKQIFDQAIKLSSSTSAQERSAALSVVISLHKFDEASTFDLLKLLYKDPSSEVRARVAFALKYFKPEQSAEMLMALLTDKDEQVLFSAIITDGVEKHKIELETLSHSKDEMTAIMAKSWLTSFSKQK